MKRFSTVAALVGSLALVCSAQSPKPLYQNDFQSAALDTLPEELRVIDGGFVVKEEGGNKFLELPGTPLDTYSVQFGPSEKEAVSASVRVYGTNKGRRFPTFAIGLNGAGGYRLQVSPAKRALELYRGETLKQSVPFVWQSAKWTWLRIQVQKAGESWKISGKAWIEGASEPAEWTITSVDSEALPAGRASLTGSPYADTPIRFDDLTVAKIAEK